MNFPQQKLLQGNRVWRIGFRLGMIGFLVTYCIAAQAQTVPELVPVPQPILEEQTEDKKKTPSLVPPTPELPSAPAEKEPKVQPKELKPIPSMPVPEAARPNLKPVAPPIKVKKPKKNQPKPQPKADVKQEEKQEVNTKREENTKTDQHLTQWTMLISPGPSSKAGVSSQAELVKFDLDKKTGEMVGAPETKKIGFETGAETKAAFGSAASCETKPSVADYEAVYQSIPFSRAEYLANPSYRHEATMELLFGQLRPTVVHKQTQAKRVYNQPRLQENPTPAPNAHPIPYSWYSPVYGPANYFSTRYPYWTPNSTYRRYPTHYGPLFNRYYRPLGY